jgi:hypothetical protein
MNLNRRDLILSGLTAGTLLSGSALFAQNGKRTIERLTEEQLGLLLEAMGMEPKKTDKRYDFAFRTALDGDEWNFTMSAVLSKDETSIWIMAWLDPLPRSAADVPRTALLRLLAENDRMGNGKFFAYIASNRRFVLQRVVENREMNTAKFAAVLKDIGRSVKDTYPFWKVENWTSNGDVQAQDDDRQAPTNPAASARANGGTTKN